MSDHDYIPIGFFVLGVAGVFLTILAGLAFYQIRKAAKGLTDLTEIVNRDLPGILQNLRSITTSLDETAHTVQSDITRISESLEKIKRIGTTIGAVEQLVYTSMQQPIFRTYRRIFAIARGLQTFLTVFRGKVPLGK